MLKLPQLHLATGNNKLRPGLAYIQIKDNLARCTNQHIGIVNELEEGYFPNGYILNDDWKKIASKRIIAAKHIEVFIHCVYFDNGKREFVEIIPFEAFEYNFPSIDAVIPQKENALHSIFSVSSYEMNLLCKVYPNSRIKFCVSGANKPIRFDVEGKKYNIYGAISTIFDHEL
jgi:hypothetical protein